MPEVGVSDADWGGIESSRNGVADDDDIDAVTSGEGLLLSLSTDMAEASSSLTDGVLAIPSSSSWFPFALSSGMGARDAAVSFSSDAALSESHQREYRHGWALAESNNSQLCITYDIYERHTVCPLVPETYVVYRAKQFIAASAARSRLPTSSAQPQTFLSHLHRRRPLLLFHRPSLLSATLTGLNAVDSSQETQER